MSAAPMTGAGGDDDRDRERGPDGRDIVPDRREGAGQMRFDSGRVLVIYDRDNEHAWVQSECFLVPPDRRERGETDE